MIKIDSDAGHNAVIIAFEGKIDAGQAQRGYEDLEKLLPNPDWDIGFDIMSRSHYSKDVRIHTVRTWEETRARLGDRVS